MDDQSIVMSNTPKKCTEHSNEVSKQTKETDFIADLELRIRQALVELQIKRRNELDSDRRNFDISRQDQELIAARAENEELKRGAEKAAAAVNRLVQERDVEAKKSADFQTKIQLLEGENEGMRVRLRDLVSSNEELSRRETSARARLAGHDSSRAHIQRQLDRFNRTMDSLQENHQRMETELKRLENEVVAAKGQREMSLRAEEHQRRQLEVTKDNLRKAYDDIARLTSKLSEGERVQNSLIKKEPNFEQQLKRESELQNRILEERAAAEVLREALDTAAAAQSRLLALNQT